MSEKYFSVGDVAHRNGVHESEVITWASENRVPILGREFVFNEQRARRFKKWLSDQLEDVADVTDDDDDDDDDSDEEGEEDEEDEGESSDDADEEDDD